MFHVKQGPAARLLAAAETMGVPLSPAQAGELVALFDRIALEPQNLTSIEDVDEAVDRHLADSLAGLTAPEISGPLVDLGSGGGFPGLVLAMLRPEMPVTLVESEKKKARWLEAASAALPNVRVVADRSEHLAKDERGAYATVTARAVAPLVPVIELAAPFVAERGHALVWSTPMAPADEARAAEAAGLLGLQALPVRPVRPFADAERVLRVFRRVAPTPPKFPRRPGRAVARPIA